METARQHVPPPILSIKTMSDIYVTETDEAQLAATALAVKSAVDNQRRKETIQSVVTALLGFGVVIALLALIALIPSSKVTEQIIAYQAPPQEEDPPIKMKELTNNAQPKPPGASASMAKVIAAEATSAVAVPIPDVSIPDATFGMEEDFGPGFGSADGDGSGGGGATFFGSRREGKRVVFCVDYSGSMESDGGAGGTRISALKKELAASIKRLPKNMSFAVIFFSTNAWSIETEGPDYVGNGWNGLGEVPNAAWYPATQRVKAEVTGQIQKMPAKGGTNWFQPLKMAFNMSPRPNIVYLLSDGEPRDDVLNEMSEINPTGIPIDTIAFELPGTPAAQLMEIAQETGGKFTMIYQGKRLTGSAAEKLTDEDYD